MSRKLLPASRRYPTEFYVAVALGLATLAVFLRTCANDFIDLDDFHYVVNNAEVKAGLSPAGVRWAFTTFHAANWHPLTWLSLQLDASLYGLNAWGFHLTNVLLHTANTVLLFWVLRRMTGAVWSSAAVAALFALHPLHVESVAWVAERKDVLSTLFWMLTLLAYLRYVEQPQPARYVLVLLALALGLMAKPMLVTLPFVLLLLDYWPLGRTLWWRPITPSPPPHADPSRLLLEKLPLFAIVAVSSVMTYLAQQKGGAVRSLIEYTPEVRVANALIAYVAYFGKTFWPVGLAVHYPHTAPRLLTPAVIGSALLLIGVTTAAVWRAKRQPYVLVGWLWYLGTLVPVIGLVQVGIQAYADRYTYVPLIGVFIALVWGAVELTAGWRTRRQVLTAGAVVVLAACTALTWVQIGAWRHTIGLWEHTLAVTVDNYEAHLDLATTLGRAKRIDEAIHHLHESLKSHPDKVAAHTNLAAFLDGHGRRDQAVPHYQAILALKPDHSVAHNNLAAIFLHQGKTDDAIRHFREALRVNPDDAGAHNNLASALAGQGKWEEAATHLVECVRIEPGNAEVHHQLGLLALRDAAKSDEAAKHLAAAVRLQPNNAEAVFDLGTAYRKQGKLREAITRYHDAVALQPRSVKYHCNLAHAYQEAGEKDAADKHYREASRINPRWVQSAQQTAWRWATHPDAAARNGAQAVPMAEQICQATGFRHAEYVDTLAAAYAEAGRFDDAVSTARKALALAEAAGQTDLAKAVQRRLSRYERRQPFRAE